jgi:hypothetical protein
MDAMARRPPVRRATWTALLLISATGGVPARHTTTAALPGVPAGLHVAQSEPRPAWARAVVAVRVHADEDRAHNPDGFDPRQARGPTPPVEGAGFFVTPLGHLITTWDLASGRPIPVSPGREGQQAEEPGAAPRADAARSRLEVVWPGEDSEPPRVFEATVVAGREDLNLALLLVDVRGEVPVVPFGDSDGPGADERLTAVTLAPPRKGEVERAAGARDRRARAPIVLPPGLADPADSPRQAPLAVPRVVAVDPQLVRFGNGGPVLDPEGYAVGVLQSRVSAADGATRTIPIDIVKDFLEENGLAGLFPARLTLGPPQVLEAKGLRLAVPAGMTDTWAGRTRWLSPPDGSGLGLRVDRLYSPAPPADLAAALLAGNFGGVPAWRDESATTTRRGRAGGARAAARRAMADADRAAGTAYGIQRDVPWGSVYAVMAVGSERVVAHYSAPADLLAYNRGVLRRALESLEAIQLIRKPGAGPVSGVRFEAVTVPASGASPVQLPSGWVHEPVAEPQPGAGLPPPDVVLSSSPVADFTVTLRYAHWSLSPGAPDAAAAAAAGERGLARGPAYEHQDELHGVAWVVRGAFSAEGRALRLHELRAPADRAEHLAGLFEAWLRAR